MSRILIGLALVLVLVASLVTKAPARLLGSLLPGEMVVMQGFRGTLWQGSASRVLVQAGPGYLHLGAVDWSLRPLSLLLLAPRLEFESRWGGQRLAGELTVRGAQDLELSDFDASVNAQLARHYAPVELGGILSAQFAALILRDGLPHSAEGRLVWQRAAWSSPAGPQPLGSYAVDLQQSPGEPLVGEVLTLSGPVEASGTLQLAGRSYRVDMLVGSEGPLDQQLQQALSLLASPRGDRFQLVLEGEFQ